MKYTIIINLVMLAWANCSGQHDNFRDIVWFDSSQLKPKVLYFHFDGCPPCKKMDQQVFSDQVFMKKLAQQYELYSVYNFNKYESAVRKKHQNKTNPEFIVLSDSNVILHRFAGFFDKEAFKEQIDLAFTDEALSKLEMQYPSNKDNYTFLKKYFEAKENAAQLDSTLIFEYLDTYNGDKYSKDYIYGVAHYGYYNCKKYVRYGDRYYNLLSHVYNMN